MSRSRLLLATALCCWCLREASLLAAVSCHWLCSLSLVNLHFSPGGCVKLLATISFCWKLCHIIGGLAPCRWRICIMLLEVGGCVQSLVAASFLLEVHCVNGSTHVWGSKDLFADN